MAITFTTVAQCQKYLEKACGVAVRKTAEELGTKLKELILSEYYDEYTPKKYERTWQFLSSAMVNDLNELTSEVLMDANRMYYGAYWDGETQIEMAARGYHGGIEIHTEGRFWNAFIDYCNANAIDLLKKNLKAQGINVK